MAEQIQQTKEKVISNDADAQQVVQTTTTKTAATDADRTDTPDTAARVVWFITGLLMVLLAFRFMLSLLGANRENGFADLIYSITYPFVAPFFGLFGYQVQYGVSRFEIETLVAMAVFALIGYGIARLLTINRRQRAV